MTHTVAVLLPDLIQAVNQVIIANADEVTKLDQALGDGDHIANLQRGITALMAQKDELATLDWQAALQKIGMSVMSAVGGASGSLYGTLFIAMAKALQGQSLNVDSFGDVFSKAVDAVKQRGKADKGEKTMLDVLIPVAELLNSEPSKSLTFTELLTKIKQTAEVGAESTRAMIATKGRASFLGERSKGQLDAGAKSSQLMICAIVDVLAKA